MTIIEAIKNSIRNALYEFNHDIVFHVEEIHHTGFPMAVLSLKNFQIEPCLSDLKQKCEFDFEIIYMQSKENKVIELFEAQNGIQKALLPVINILGKKVTVDSPCFTVREDKLFMTFSLNFYIFEQEEGEKMKELDFTLKEDKNAG